MPDFSTTFRLMLMSIIAAIGSNGFAQNVITGSVVDNKSLVFLPGAHVYTLKRGAVTDSSGVFKISISEVDSLYVSMVGYKTTAIPITDIYDLDEVIIPLAQQDYLLDVVLMEGDEEFETIIELPEIKPMYMFGGPLSREDNDQDFHMGIARSIMSPFTALNRLTNKKYKEKKEYYKLKKKETAVKKARERAYSNIDALLKNQRLFVDRLDYDKLLENCKLSIVTAGRLALYDLIKHAQQTNCLSSYQ